MGVANASTGMSIPKLKLSIAKSCNNSKNEFNVTAVLNINDRFFI
jgi:hypothetical protein